MIKIAILGYGHLGKGVEDALSQNQDMELVGIFSRRPAEQVESSGPVYPLDQLLDFQDQVDVLILCGSSDRDLPDQTPYYAQYFNTVDSFDTHDQIPTYFEKVDQAARQSSHLSIISIGWDPGLFSLHRMMAEAIQPQGSTYTFWGPGKSQGHGAAVRQLDGIQDAVQYTLPSKEMLEAIDRGEEIDYQSKSAHQREVYAVLEEGADPEQLEASIVHLPHYFEGYETCVHFVSQEELDRDHAGLPHGGHVFRQGQSKEGQSSLYEFHLSLSSNPAFTAAVNVAYARACYRLAQEGQRGARTIFDIAPALLSARSAEDLRRDLL